MHRIALAAAAALAVLFPSAAMAAPDRDGVVSEAAPNFTWDGPLAAGYNTARDPAACSHDVQTYCDQTLIKVDTPAGSTAELKITTGEYFGPQCTPLDGQSAPCDFSLWLYQSDASGKVGKNVGSSINDSGEDEEITFKRATPGHYLVVVYYYTVAASSYVGTATLSNVTLPPPPPAPAPAEPAAPALTLTTKSLSARKAGRRLRLALAASAPVTRVRAVLRKGARTLAAGSLARLDGAGRVTLALRRRLRPATYRVLLSAVDANGGAVRTTATLRVRR